MASLTDFSPTVPSWNGPAEISNDALQMSRATTQAGIDKTRATDQFNQVTLPGLVNAAAGAGDFYGGMLHQNTALATQSYNNNIADINTALAQKRADLTRAGFLASTGIAL